MQQQEQQVRRPATRSRVNLNLGFSLLLILTGAVTAILCVDGYLGYLARKYFVLRDVLIYGTWMLQSTMGLLGGVFSLARSRTLVRWCLTLASVFSVATTVVLLVDVISYYLRGHFPKEMIPMAIVIFFGMFSLAGILYFLGRWLSQEED